MPADLPRVAIVQIFRIFVLMALLPMAARIGASAQTAAYAVDPVVTTLGLVLLGAIIGQRVERVGLANGSLYASIFISLLAHGTGFAPGRLAPDMQIVAQTLIGGVITHPYRLARRACAEGQARVARMTLKGFAARRRAVSIVVRTSASAWAAHTAG